MSCPKCGDESVRQDAASTWWLHDRVFKAQETTINFCPFCGANLAAPPLKWTQEKPTQLGLYWCAWPSPEPRGPLDAKWQMAIFHSMEDRYTGPEERWWYGPLAIEKPEPPKEDA
jgi:hypothetical protein